MSIPNEKLPLKKKYKKIEEDNKGARARKLNKEKP
tara:strand:- start:582 stop:686 length:105 start_codon:yes stop_codon:yes gene_type:complete